MKTALLVCFSPMTRVVMDIPDGQTVEEFLNNDYNYADVCRTAREKMQKDIGDYLCADTCESIVEDAECPAGTYTSDNA